LPRIRTRSNFILTKKYELHGNTIHSMKVIIVGGLAGGASCAARLRKLDEKAEILLLERGACVSYASCGLAYHGSTAIEKESSLLLATEQSFKTKFGIDCRTGCEVIGISVKNKTVQIQNLKTDAISVENYDKLVLSPGTEATRPSLPGIDLPGIFSLRTVPDARNIREWLNQDVLEKTGLNSYTGFRKVRKPTRAVVIGGGFIGLEMVENLIHLGLEVTLIEELSHLMPSLDPEMARLVEKYTAKHGVKLELNDGVVRFEKNTDGSLEVITGSGKKHVADIVILAMGLKPETRLAKMAGIEIGMQGGIRVDDHMRTSNPDIYAVGESIEVRDIVTGEWSMISLAGPANRQGCIAADVIAGRNSVYRGTQGTSICKIFETVVGQTGASEKILTQLGAIDFEKILIYPDSHAGNYPGAKMMSIKVLFRRSDGHLLGAQVVGEEGVSRRIDAFAVAIQMGCTIYNLEETELSFAPLVESTKDPVNPAGMVAADFLHENMPVRQWKYLNGIRKANKMIEKKFN
jgi:NADPH-dependent 2,4-dienoyl-CoA reductase/sulfur reductase-like enzyme